MSEGFRVLTEGEQFQVLIDGSHIESGSHFEFSRVS